MEPLFKICLAFVLTGSLQNAAAQTTTSTTASSHAQVFLDSLYINARIQAPRLSLAASRTHLATPSLLQQWGILNADAAASYNGFTSTLVLRDDMLFKNSSTGEARIASLREIHDRTHFSARVAAGVIFHELSHAEYDFFVEEEAENFDRELIRVLKAELPKVIAANGVSFFRSIPLGSEIFAYYREELIEMILQDAAEIKLASGLEPDKDACTPVHTRPVELRDFFSSQEPYEKRAHLTTAFVFGDDVNLDLAMDASRKINQALWAHAKATLKIPESRADLFRQLSLDPRLRAARVICLAIDEKKRLGEAPSHANYSLKKSNQNRRPAIFEKDPSAGIW